MSKFDDLESQIYDDPYVEPRKMSDDDSKTFYNVLPLDMKRVIMEKLSFADRMRFSRADVEMYRITQRDTADRGILGPFVLRPGVSDEHVVHLVQNELVVNPLSLYTVSTLKDISEWICRHIRAFDVLEIFDVHDGIEELSMFVSLVQSICSKVSMCHDGTVRFNFHNSTFLYPWYVFLFDQFPYMMCQKEVSIQNCTVEDYMFLTEIRSVNKIVISRFVASSFPEGAFSKTAATLTELWIQFGAKVTLFDTPLPHLRKVTLHGNPLHTESLLSCLEPSFKTLEMISISVVPQMIPDLCWLESCEKLREFKLGFRLFNSDALDLPRKIMLKELTSLLVQIHNTADGQPILFLSKIICPKLRKATLMTTKPWTFNVPEVDPTVKYTHTYYKRNVNKT